MLSAVMLLGASSQYAYESKASSQMMDSDDEVLSIEENTVELAPNEKVHVYSWNTEVGDKMDYFYEKYGYNDETLIADPNKYGTHNITINAVDLLLVDLNGDKVELPCEFDDFSKKANIHYEDCSDIAKQNRDLLINTCNKYGLIVNEDEWWHYYDIKLEEYGMKYSYKDSNLKPKMEEEVFILEQ